MEKLIDTYVTGDEADAYINKRYRSNSPMRTAWGLLPTEEKEVILVNACAEIELLPFQGRKAVIGQPLAFPRLPLQYGDAQEPPKNIGYAQIELALWLSDSSNQEKLEKRQALQAAGVEGFSIGDLSESYNAGADALPAPLACAKSAALLKPYINGGYAIC